MWSTQALVEIIRPLWSPIQVLSEEDDAYFAGVIHCVESAGIAEAEGYSVSD